MAPHPKSTDPLVPIAARVRESKRRRLRAIRELKGHQDLSDTIREAIDLYLEANADLFRLTAA